MINNLNKKFLVLFVAAVFSAAQTPPVLNAEVIGSLCVQFNRDLRQGMRDMDAGGVFGLQGFLNARGYLRVQPTGFFGSLTLSAVKNFQSANGISSTGFVGPITRVKINTLVCLSASINYPAGCTSNLGFSATPGKSCAATAYPAGCASSIGFSSTTGKRCDEAVTTTSTTTTTATYPHGCTSTSGFSSTTGNRCDGTTSTTTTTTTSTGTQSSNQQSSTPASSPYPDGCTSFSGSSVTTDMPCDGSVPPPDTTSPPGCAESNYNPETGEACG